MDNPYGKQIDIKMNGNPHKDTVHIDGEPVPRVQRIVVDSGLDNTVVELDIIQVPDGGTMQFSGYLISEEDMQILRQAKANREFGEEAVERIASRG